MAFIANERAIVELSFVRKGAKMVLEIRTLRKKFKKCEVFKKHL
jgi:hypothetical protein